MNKQDLQQT